MRVSKSSRRLAILRDQCTGRAKKAERGCIVLTGGYILTPGRNSERWWEFRKDCEEEDHVIWSLKAGLHFCGKRWREAEESLASVWDSKPMPACL